MPAGAAATSLLSCRTPAPPLPPPRQRAAASAVASHYPRSRHRRISCSCGHSSAGSSDSSGWPSWQVVLRAVAGAAISFSLLTSSLPLSPDAVAAAADATAAVQLPPASAPSKHCSGEEEPGAASEGREPYVVTNKDIVEEAWEVVNESFLDVGDGGWSPEKWLQKKMDILKTTVPTRSRAHDIIRKMLASLGDPYTRFLTPAEFSKMARYDVTGIGVNLREVPDDSGAIRLKVLGIILDGPAHLAGIRQGDDILSVNGVDTKGKSAFEVSSLLQGPKETFVTVEVQHGDCGTLRSIKVKRQSVARTPVFYRLEQMENGTASIGYVQLKEFNALAKKDLVTAMKRLQDAGVSCFVLDLRDNRGGLVQAGIEIAKVFLDEGQSVIYTVGRDPEVQKSIVAETAPLFTTPVIILVNSRTASASEIVAAALHDNCKGVLAGERTYGKSVFELHDGSGVVVTIGKYVTPNHMDINGNGIEPDFPKIPALSKVTERISECQISRKA
uniref:C-terminal processing peptidase n=1 Tax=Anthurium amnicola TaxID=1678845 RepID=A0A1D1YIU2_9ARAE